MIRWVGKITPCVFNVLSKLSPCNWRFYLGYRGCCCQPVGMVSLRKVFDLLFSGNTGSHCCFGFVHLGISIWGDVIFENCNTLLWSQGATVGKIIKVHRPTESWFTYWENLWNCWVLGTEVNPTLAKSVLSEQQMSFFSVSWINLRCPKQKEVNPWH